MQYRLTFRRIDPSGLSEADIEKIKENSDPNYFSKKKQKALKLKEERQKLRDRIPETAVDEDRVLYWMWSKLNPLYRQYVPKRTIVGYLSANLDILQAFGFHEKEYERVVTSMITEKADHMNFDEFDVTDEADDRC